ncbi:MAG: hypothetical protein V4727_10735 [Verrucomicrobiota bacterium]
MSKKRNPHSWVTYERCYLITIGLALISLAVIIWVKSGHEASEWPGWAHVLFIVLPLLGFTIIAVGLKAKRQTIQNWAEGISRHEAFILIMILAFPIYLLCELLSRRNGKR